MTIRPPWETEIDTPATVAILGGGAIGIEAALYARFLGYYVLLIEGAKMAQSWRVGSHLPMLVPFGQAASKLGIAALQAHRPDTPLPAADAVLTGLEFAERYLVPLARTDLLIESVQVHSRVMSVSRVETRRESPGDIQDRADIEYRLAIHSKNRGWYAERADIILDCSGVSDPRSLAPGGGLAMGQIEQAHVIDTGLPDLLGKQRATYAGQRLLLFGTSHAAFQNLLSLYELVLQEPSTRVTWLIPLDYGQDEPIAWLDRLQATGEVGQKLAQREEIKAALSGLLPGIVTLPALGIERLNATPQGLAVCVQVNEDSTLDLTCDRIISSAGLQADWQHARALRVGESSVLARPALEFANASNTETGSVDLVDSLLTMEPHYYVLGSKSFGLAHDRFTLSQGHQQIRQAFALIGGRDSLNLYENIQQT